LVNGLVERPLVETPDLIGEVQTNLATIGLYRGPIDKLKGKKTIEALNAFKSSTGLLGSDGISQRTRDMLAQQAALVTDLAKAKETLAKKPAASLAPPPMPAPTPPPPPVSSRSSSDSNGWTFGLIVLAVVVAAIFYVNRTPATASASYPSTGRISTPSTMTVGGAVKGSSPFLRAAPADIGIETPPKGFGSVGKAEPGPKPSSIVPPPPKRSAKKRRTSPASSTKFGTRTYTPIDLPGEHESIGWLCDDCHSQNSEDATNCVVCGTAR
jgi:hypothetical protein